MFGRLSAVWVVIAAVLVVAPAAFGATPHDIYKDLADDGRLDATYTQAELQAYANDATVQGYGNPVVPPPTVYVCPPGTTPAPGSGVYAPGEAPQGATQLPAPAGACATPPQLSYVCPPGTTPAPGSGAYPEGGAPAGTQETPAPEAACLTPAAPQTPVQQVAGARKTIQTPAPQMPAPAAAAQPERTSQVAGVRTPPRPALADAAPAETLPFTGAELAIFALVGAALLAAGVVLRFGANRR